MTMRPGSMVQRSMEQPGKGSALGGQICVFFTSGCAHNFAEKWNSPEGGVGAANPFAGSRDFVNFCKLLA